MGTRFRFYCSRALLRAFSTVLLVASLGLEEVGAEQIPITILHTNDIHSRFNPDKGPFGLGGMARVATTVRRVRQSVKNSLLLDGGDWSEGHIYYNLDAGRTAIEMMNSIGYDAAVVGNHDWLNGPDHMLDLFRRIQPTFALLGANLDFSKYKLGDALKKFIDPYRVVNVGGLKVGLIGLATYELIYDKWFQPVAITEPFAKTRKLAARLKDDEGCDLVVVLSHNPMGVNKYVAGLANVDIVIHAHDHAKLSQPVPVTRNGKTALIVEADQWGYYVGRLDLVVDTETKTFTYDYKLIQQDETVPDDPVIATLIRDYDQQLVKKYGDIFQEKIADSKLHVRRESAESLIGNLVTDAYRDYTGADVSFEQSALINGELFSGPVYTVDLYNALSHVWNPFTGKTWTVRTMKMTGSTIRWLMNMALSVFSYIPGGMLSTSGLHAVYDPVGMNRVDSLVGRDGEFVLDQGAGQQGLLATESRGALKSLEIGGKPVDDEYEYLVALSGGLYEAIEFIESTLGNKITRSDVRDTGAEGWKVLADYVKKNSPIQSSLISRGRRFSPLQPDLGLYHDEIVVSRRNRSVEAVVTVRNLGETVSAPTRLSLAHDKTPSDSADDPNPTAAGVLTAVPAIAPGSSVKINLGMTLPAELSAERVPLYFILDTRSDDPNKGNDRTWLLVDSQGRMAFDESSRIEAPEANIADH